MASLARNLRGVRRVQDLGNVLAAFARSLVVAPRLWARLGQCLDSCDGVVLLAPGEARDLIGDVHWSGRNGRLAPNGAPLNVACSRAWSERTLDILVAGRVEPRKRSLEIARCAHALNIAVDFIGPIVAEDSKFGREFAQLARDSEWVRHHGLLQHSRVIEAMGNAKVVLNGSWVECQSLVDIEAAFCGARVVSSRNGNSSDWIPDSIRVVDSESVGDLLHAAVEEAGAVDAPLRPVYPWTWRNAADIVLEMLAGVHESAGPR